MTDNDVDAAVAALLRNEGHEAWTASEAGLAEASDADLAVYADDQGAALISHDREFSQWRQANTSGQHIVLMVPQPDAAEVVAEYLDQLLFALEHNPHVVIEVRRDSYRVHRGRWD